MHYSNPYHTVCRSLLEILQDQIDTPQCNRWLPGSPLLQHWDMQVATNMSLLPRLLACQVTTASNAIQQSTAFAFHALFSPEIIRHRFVFIYFCTPSLSPISFYQNIIYLPNKSHKSYCLLKYFWELCGKTIKRTKLWKQNLNIKSIIVEYWVWDNSGMIFCQQSKFNLKFGTSVESVFSQNVDGGSNTSWKYKYMLS